MERDTILIVDDNQVNRVILRKILESEYAITEAGDGTAGLASLEKLQNRLCLVILDIWMPLLDGIGVLSAMRAKGWLSTIPVIVITSDATTELESRLLTFGVQYVIPKPFNPTTVKDCVRDAIANHGTAAAGQMMIAEADRQKNLLTRINTFLYEYDHADGISHIDARYMSSLRGNWHAFRLDAPERVRDCIYRPDFERFAEFLGRECGADYETLDLRMLTITGGYEWFRIGRLRYDDERGAHTVLTFTNVSEEMRARERLEFLARNDSLTQIPNLQAFFDNTRQMLLDHPDGTFAVLRMGVERFSVFNQLYGRAEGDRLLRYVAVKLQEEVGTDDFGTYCRIRSDNFAACVCDENGRADELIDSLQTALRAYPVNFEIALCFGRFDVDDKHAPVDDMLERAGVAQRTVKGNYNRHLAAYDAALRARDETERKIMLDMQDALKSGQFVMFLQPKCDMFSGRIAGSEALVRWLHPERGMISPGVFIPLFERNGFISELDRVIIEQACRTLRGWIDAGLPALPISVNISRADLYNPHLLDDILDIVAHYGVPHELLGFELTESSFVVDNSMVGGLTELLKKNGFCVLMDDFGSGYSSLNTLKDIYVNVLKIDLRFLQAADDAARANHILCSICKMAQDIDLDVIVEGVETAEQAELLKSIGVRYAQGYYYHRPMPVAEYEHLLQRELAATPVK